MKVTIRKATLVEYPTIISLLASHHLPTSDIGQSAIALFVALINNEIVGTVGIEKYAPLGLLRSLAVKENFKNQKIGEAMLEKINELCAQEGISDLYLLTTTAEHYFEKHGFSKVERTNVPEAIKQTREFNDICPASAVIMCLKK